MLQIITDFASYIEVAEADVAEGRVHKARRDPQQVRLFPRLLDVRQGATG